MVSGMGSHFRTAGRVSIFFRTRQRPISTGNRDAVYQLALDYHFHSVTRMAEVERAPVGTGEPASGTEQRRTKDGLGQLAFDWTADWTQAPPEPTTPAGPKEVPAKVPDEDPPKTKSTKQVPAKSRPLPHLIKRCLREIVERHLRDKGIPYINVDEAKKALFAGAKLRSFHFVVYFKDGKNWLLYTSQLRKESRDDLRQWEQIFGDGFVAVVGKQTAKGELRFQTLMGEALELP